VTPFPVLVVEDDPILARAVQRSFGKAGLPNPVHLVHDGVEALAFLRGEGPWTDETAPTPGLVLLDLRMPRLDGIGVLRAIQGDATLPPVPVVVVSGTSRAADRRTCYELGAKGYFVKPDDLGGYVALVRTLCDYWTLAEAP